MKRLLCLAACIAVAAAPPPVAKVGVGPPFAPPDAATVKAVQKLGGSYYLLVRDEWGYPLSESARSRRGRGGLPCFWFCTHPDSTLIALPPIHVPFGLDLPRAEVSEAGLKHLATRPTLRHLRLDTARLTEPALRRLGELAGLESLDLFYVGMTDAGLKHVAKLKRLRYLALFEPRLGLGDAGLAHLARLMGLEGLRIESPAISDAGLKQLQGLKNLRHLSLIGCPVTDAGLKHLAGLSRLHSLELYGTKVTDDGLKHLAGLKNLRNVSLGDTRVTDEGVARLRKALPKLEVER